MAYPGQIHVQHKMYYEHALRLGRTKVDKLRLLAKLNAGVPAIDRMALADINDRWTGIAGRLSVWPTRWIRELP